MSRKLRSSLACSLSLACTRALSMSTVVPTTIATAEPRFAVGIDGAASPSALTSKEFLLSLPSGAYTTARTCSRGTRIFEWDTHVERTAASVEAMLNEADASPALLEGLARPERLRPRLEATVAAAKRQYLEAHGDEGELKLTLLVSWRGGGGECEEPLGEQQEQAAVRSDEVGSVACHVAPLPPLPAPPVCVEVRGAPRANALAKDSAWVAERAPLEALMAAATLPPGASMNELLLQTAEGELLEGSQTNFYALIDGAVHTAGEGVLAGTVRRLLLEVCAREGIPVVLSPPMLASAAAWEGALISSTSRLLLPVDRLYVPAEGAPSGEADLRRSFECGPASLAARLRELVGREVEAHSAAIL
jgi:branched-subunit amino acid aminotransferase/4-amino-4-deoxychorismate lyase